MEADKKHFFGCSCCADITTKLDRRKLLQGAGLFATALAASGFNAAASRPKLVA